MTYAWFGLRFSPPEMWIRQGLTAATARPSLRNQRPVRRRGSTSNSLMRPSSGTQSRMRAIVAAQIQADRRRRIMWNDSTVQILTLSTARSKSSACRGGLRFTQIVHVHAPADLGDGFAHTQRRQIAQRHVDALERSDVGHAVFVNFVPALLVESLGVAHLVDPVVAHLGIAEIIDARAALAGMGVQPEAQLLDVLPPVDIGIHEVFGSAPRTARQFVEECQIIGGNARALPHLQCHEQRQHPELALIYGISDCGSDGLTV